MIAGTVDSFVAGLHITLCCCCCDHRLGVAVLGVLTSVFTSARYVTVPAKQDSEEGMDFYSVVHINKFLSIDQHDQRYHKFNSSLLAKEIEIHGKSSFCNHPHN